MTNLKPFVTHALHVFYIKRNPYHLDRDFWFRFLINSIINNIKAYATVYIGAITHVVSGVSGIKGV